MNDELVEKTGDGTWTTRVYRYGALAPIENAAIVAAQMRSAHNYRNTLTQIERGRRDAIRAAVFAHGNVEAITTAAALAANVATDAAKAAKDVDPEAKDRLAADLEIARTTRRDSMKAVVVARKIALALESERVEEINELARGLVRNAREHCGTHWGSYLLVEAAVRQAAAMPLYDGLEPNDPHFERWNGEGRIGSQIQGGMTIEKVSSQDSRLRIAIEPLPENASKRQTQRRHAVLWIRVGSEGRAPIWAKVPFLLHRALPEGANIRSATVTLIRVGPTDRWSVEITVRIPAVTTERTAAVAVDLGWRVIGDEIRVASWAGEDGAVGEVRIDADLIRHLTKASSLRAIRDRNLDAARDELTKRLSALTLPEWIRQATRTLPQWRSPARFAALALRWRADRWDGDVDVYTALETWRVQDRHLWEWEAHQRMQGLDKRLKLFEAHAARLATKYGRLVLEKFNMLRVVRVPVESSPQETHARSNRQMVAPSILRNVLRNAFSTRGCAIEEVPAAGSTRECHVCAHTDEWDAAKTLEHTCSKCGTTWDQDENAAHVLLGRRERSSDAGSPGTPAGDAAPAPSRWAKARATAAARKARQGITAP